MSVAEAAIVSTKGAKTLLAGVLSTFLIKCKGWNTLFLLAIEPFPKALLNSETCVLFNNNLCGKLVSSLASPIISHEKFIKLWIRELYV